MRKIAFLSSVFCGMVVACCARAHAEGVQPRPHGCMELAQMKSIAASNGATWIDLTQEQWSFLRTVSAVSPRTPEGFPYGDKAALARSGDRSMVVFIDGSRACDVMPVSAALVVILNDVSEIRHEPPRGQDQ